MPKATRHMSRARDQEVIDRLKKLPKYYSYKYLQKEQQIKSAIHVWKVLEEYKITNLWIACSVFNVLYLMTYDQYKRAKTLVENEGNNKCLNKAQEASLIWYINLVIECGFLMQYDLITTTVAQILSAIRDKKQFGDKLVY